MKKTKTNISVVNNVGIRRDANIHVGDKGPFPSGDILDANAIQEMIDDDSLAVSAALNDLNSRVGSGGGIGEDEELIISTALNDLNSRIEQNEKASGGMIEIIYSDLKDLRDNGELVPGQWYRIIDYVTTVNDNGIDNARSAGHPFDILVMAESETVIQEQAFAIQHAGDTYFANSRLEAWEIKYRLDNVQWSLLKGTYINGGADGDIYGFKKLDTIVLGGTTYILWQGDARFAAECGAEYTVSDSEGIGSVLYTYYGDPEKFSPDELVGFIDTVTVETNDGKGTIIYMKDEFNNECAYDFKNMQFKRYMTTDSVSGREGLGGLYMVANPTNAPQGLSVDDDTDFIWAFTFSSDNSGGEQTDYSLGGHDVYNNVIKETGNQKLNSIVFFGNDCYDISFGNDCYDISFGNDCYDISFGSDCYNMLFGNGCFNISFESYCRNMSFGKSNDGMSFGNRCNNMSFGNFNIDMSFGNGCVNISFVNGCNNMSFGNGNGRISFGNSNIDMSFGNFNNNIVFGNGCYQMSFGNNNNNMSFGTYCKNCTITEGVSYVDISADTWNFQLLNGLAGTSSSHLTPSFATSTTYTQVACKNSSGALKVYVPGDLV